MFSLTFSIRGRALKPKVLQVSRILILKMFSKTYRSTGPLRDFCDWISTDPATGKISPAGGWAQKKGGKWSADRWAMWPKFGPVVSSAGPQSHVCGYL